MKIKVLQSLGYLDIGVIVFKCHSKVRGVLYLRTINVFKCYSKVRGVQCLRTIIFGSSFWTSSLGIHVELVLNQAVGL